MASASRVFIPEFPAAAPAYDSLDEGTFRKLVRDGFAGVEEYVQRAVSQYDIENAPSDGDVMTWNDTTKKWEAAPLP